MKQVIKIVVIAAAVFFAAPQYASAQKIGHLAVDSLLKIWPAYQSVVDSLAHEQTRVQDQATKMGMEYQAKVREKDSLEKTSSPTLNRLREVQLAQMEQNYNDYLDVESMRLQALQAKMTDSLYKILNNAIAAVAKEKGYTYIMDSSKGGQVMYADPALDCLDAVRIKLNIPVPKPKPAGGAPAPAPNK